MNTEQTLNNHELLSALADGQLRGTAFAQAVDSVLHDEEAQATWHRFHLIGDVMRSGELAQCNGDSAFLSRLQTRLKQEPGFARPASLPIAESAIEWSASVAGAQHVGNGADAALSPTAANAPSFRWKMLAGFASMAAVAAIGWNLVGNSGALPPQGQQMALVPAASTATVQLAQAAAPQPEVSSAPAAVVQTVRLASGEPQVMIRDPRLDELMAAHKQFGGTSALQKPAGFLRNATFEVPSR